MNKWLTYIKGDPKRQEILETALDWVSDGQIENYMAKHRDDTDINELKSYFDSVFDWISSVFEYTDKEVKGLPWGDYYRKYHTQAYDKKKITARAEELMADPFVHNKRGIFEYILSGETDTKLLEIRIFDDIVKRSKYESQTKEAKEKGISNCPLCAISNTANSNKIWEYKAMDADHVSAWSKGGKTDIDNCQMLCKIHNIAKGNK